MSTFTRVGPPTRLPQTLGTMTVSDKTRKLVWGRSGNRCARCRCPLLMEATPLANDSVIGEECHILGWSKDGPRGDSTMPNAERDQYDNLILLCPTCHSIIDDRVAEYTVVAMVEMKREHERWVSGTRWYYSSFLFPTPESLQNSIQRLLKRTA